MDERFTFSVSGLTTPGSEKTLTDKLMNIAGVTEVSVSAREGRIYIAGNGLNRNVLSQAISQSECEVEGIL